MKCPECDHEIEKEDLAVSIGDDEVNIEYECPECEHYAGIGFSQQVFSKDYDLK